MNFLHIFSITFQNILLLLQACVVFYVAERVCVFQTVLAERSSIGDWVFGWASMEELHWFSTDSEEDVMWLSVWSWKSLREFFEWESTGGWESMGRRCFARGSMGNCGLELGSKWLWGLESESVVWGSFEWDSTVGSDSELQFLCDIWEVTLFSMGDDDKAVWFNFASIVVPTKLEECKLTDGAGLLPCRPMGGDLSSWLTTDDALMSVSPSEAALEE